MTWKKPRHFRQKNDPNSPYKKIEVYVPKSIAEIIKKKAEEVNLPMSRLICFAIDNELDSTYPFNYLVQWPLNEYIEDAYAGEAQKIYQFMMKFPSGLGRDMLTLCRRDIGVLNKKDLMLGLRELVEKDLVEEAAPSKHTTFTYSKDYKYYRLKHLQRSELINKKREQLEKLKAEIEQEEAKLGPPGVEFEVRGSSTDDQSGV